MYKNINLWFIIELEKIDPSMHWTPEGNGNSVSESTFEKILNLINKEQGGNISWMNKLMVTNKLKQKSQ